MWASDIEHSLKLGRILDSCRQVDFVIGLVVLESRAGQVGNIFV